MGAKIDVATGAVQLKDKDGKYSSWTRKVVLFKGNRGVFKRMAELCLTRILHNRNATIKWCKKNSPYYDEKLDPYVVRTICENTESMLKTATNGQVDEEKIKDAIMNNISQYSKEVDNGFVDYVCDKSKKPSKYTMRQEKKYIQNALNNCPTCVESEVEKAVTPTPWYERLINSVKNRVSTVKLGFTNKKLLAKGDEEHDEKQFDEDPYVDVEPTSFFKAQASDETRDQNDETKDQNDAGSIIALFSRPTIQDEHTEKSENAKKPENAQGDRKIRTDEARSDHDDGPEL